MCFKIVSYFCNSLSKLLLVLSCMQAQLNRVH